MKVLYHFSEDPSIRRFEPHVPVTNPAQAPAVWAIDAEHASLYWFPRQCPRIAVWYRNEGERAAFEATFATSSPRVHAIEVDWLPAMHITTVYRYALMADDFEPWAEASGQWISHRAVAPVDIEPVGDLVDAHAVAGIELRAVDSLWPLHDLAVAALEHDRWDFSIVRMANAAPRS